MRITSPARESNYDPGMLTCGAYPAQVKRRIRGPGGHLSNFEAAQVLRDCAAARLQWACLAHLSAENNRPQLALETHARVLAGRFPLHLATRYQASGTLTL